MEFKASGWSNENKRKYRTPLFIVRCFDCGRRSKIEKGYCRSTCRTVGVCLDLKPTISLYCRNCVPHHFSLNMDGEWQDYQAKNSKEGVSDDQICNAFQHFVLKSGDLFTLKHRIFCIFFYLYQLLVFPSSVFKT